jgi:hypothetical protein
MSLGIVIKGAEGLVLAAESRTSFTYNLPGSSTFSVDQ